MTSDEYCDRYRLDADPLDVDIDEVPDTEIFRFAQWLLHRYRDLVGDDRAILTEREREGMANKADAIEAWIIKTTIENVEADGEGPLAMFPDFPPAEWTE